MGEDHRRLREAVTKQTIEGPGASTVEDRRAAAANDGVVESRRAFVDKVANRAYEITDDDIASLKQAGISEDEIFELAVCAAIGQATRQLDAAMAALDEAEKVPAKP
jgi:hypothetical protein